MVKLDPIVSESVVDVHIRCFPDASIARKRNKRGERGDARHAWSCARDTIHVHLRTNRLIERNPRVAYVFRRSDRKHRRRRRVCLSRDIVRRIASVLFFFFFLIDLIHCHRDTLLLPRYRLSRFDKHSVMNIVLCAYKCKLYTADKDNAKEDRVI